MTVFCAIAIILSLDNQTYDQAFLDDESEEITLSNFEIELLEIERLYKNETVTEEEYTKLDNQ